jgi:exonuclease III
MSIFPFYIVENNEELANPTLSCHHYNIDDLEAMLFDPFNSDADEPNLFDDIDPDKKFYNLNDNNITKRCKYSYPETLCNLTKDWPLLNNFSLMHHNIRSLRKNHTNFEILLKTIGHKFSIIGLTETWLKDHNTALYELDGYAHEFLTRPIKAGGGVSMFISENLNYKVREDLSYIDNNFEFLWIEVDKTSLNKTNNIIVGTIYRRPGTNITDFNNILQEKLSIISKENKTLYHMGDYNIDLIKHEIHQQTAEFLDYNFTHALQPLINKPTRVTVDSATLIDNIFTNNIDCEDTISAIIPVDVTDHFPVCFLTKSKEIGGNNNPSSNAQKNRRDFSRKNINKFNKAIEEQNWNEVLNTADTQDSYTKFHTIFNNLFIKKFPYKKSSTPYNTKLPWLIIVLKNAIKTKNRLYNKLNRAKSKENLAIYKNYKNRLNHLLRAAERIYYHDLLEQNKHNLRKSWQTINEVINRKRKLKHKIDSFLINGKSTTDSQQIADHFNRFFTNIGSELDKKIPKTSTDPISYLKNTVTNTIYLRPTNPEEINKIITNLKTCAPGWDEFPSIILKENHDLVSTCLTHIINQSFTQGIFPSELKIAILIPIFKAGESSDVGNYRPISLLSTFSKIFERVFYQRLIDYLNKNKLIYDLQFGFRQKYSTQMAIICLMDKIINALEKGNYTVGIFLDFSKAFDTVNHDILITKLDRYGIRGNAKKWITSYLTDRQQYCSYNNLKSANLKINCGVPQGSILGPLLFIIYLNDLANISDKLSTILFADDSNVFIDGPDLTQVQNILNDEIPKLVDWLCANRLSLNIKKTHFMIFGQKKKNTNTQLSININGQPIELVKQTKFLGLMLDDALSWKPHSIYISKKIAKAVGIIARARRVLPGHTLLQLYYSFMYPYLSYCNLAWGNTSFTTLWPIFKSQKLAIRLVANQKSYTSTLPFCKKKNILRLPEIYQQSAALFMYKYKNGFLPNIFDTFFTCNNENHRYPTRAGNKFRTPFTKTTLATKFITRTGAKLWNELEEHVTTNVKIGTFKIKVKSYLTSNY